MKSIFTILLIFCLKVVAAQKILVLKQDYLNALKPGAPIPEKILSGRTAVLYDNVITPTELNEIHSYFQRIGIDAIGYFRFEKAIGGFDVRKKFASYFANRSIDNIIILTRSSSYSIYIFSFAENDFAMAVPPSCWTTSNVRLNEMLRTVYRTAASTFKKKNFLINDLPETEFDINIINGVRNETFSYDLKVDAIAIPKFNNDALDKELEEICKNYPLKYKLVDPGIEEAELRTQGFHYILRFVHAPCVLGKELTGYEISDSESAFVSVTYPNGLPVLKTIAAETEVFKFYAKKIDSENIFLGNKWDADTTWQDALRNYIKGLRIEFKLN